MKVNNPFAGFEQFALSTQEVAMVKGGEQDLTGDLTGDGGFVTEAGACGNENAYTCTVRFDGGGSMTGTGCGPTSGHTTARLYNSLIAQGVSEIVAYVTCV